MGQPRVDIPSSLLIDMDPSTLCVGETVGAVNLAVWLMALGVGVMPRFTVSPGSEAGRVAIMAVPSAVSMDGSASSSGF
jgi:hypothetical protein